MNSIDAQGGHPRYGNYIGGHQVAARENESFVSINPTTGREWGTFAQSTAADVDDAVLAASAALKGPWGRLSPSARGRLLIAWGEKIAEHALPIATLETEQNGKLLAEMHAQAKIVKDWLFYFGGLADKVEGSVIPLERPSVLNYTLREPLGVISVIVPWNSPTLITIMSMAPALAAGNTIVLKPSEITSASAFELARLAEAAGIPAGVINVVTGARESGDALVTHPGVAKIFFTGSEPAGRSIAAKAGSRLAGCTLELGGKSANIVFADARLDQAEAGVLAGIFAAAGQTCIAGSRAYVHRSIYEPFVERLVARARQIRLGNPLLAETQMGPVATSAQLAKDITMVGQAREDGAELLCGGTRATVPGYEDGLFFEPTIFGGTTRAHRIMNEEVFGPVLCVTPFDDDEEVLAEANGTRFGLAAGMWTCSLQRAHSFAKRLEAGTVWINMYRALAFNSPFGGYKASGVGRVNGAQAIEQYLQTKSVWCELGNEVQDPFVLRT
ncbi:(Z)-2-((N-methylformamido)methylene)-5-hydroxybutyrolactone dehydrogenase [Paraburkholderia hiiakae]|uniref:(Z)-2-((N-methylformamido)methylene)-5-hydroxybutyrolactone dehydrogenase n=1 Tax=Paraburkholderia hiiakae TaxID=1081782 RepID=A0ABM8NTZ7_9BURK|nr:aldehyde dehydrogenase [Paraburkholderia hiiakae]CAD6543317.1 (Z)-2-((N-methylformamido)methylene)-5-hydroxybutyrolactone dehydrogenase [Paraburkholderia hiiakae]